MNNLVACAPPLICLIRHGETPFSVARRYNGRVDAPLTSNGEQAARELQPALADLTWSSVCCSNLSRARRTAELAGFPNATVVPDLRECDYGDFEGKTTEEIHALAPGWDFWRDGCPKGEDPAGLGRRLQPVAAQLRSGDDRTLVFSHSHAIRVLTAILLGLSPLEGAIFNIEPARLNVVRINRVRAELALWNDGSYMTAPGT
jgi:broad specificity phosphatase PhoE